MTAPPGVEPVASAHRNQRERTKTAANYALINALINKARTYPELDHLSIGTLGRAVRYFIKAGLHERDLVSWVIGYCDPTGETAVRHVMRERGW